MEENSVENKTPEKRSYNLIKYIIILAVLMTAAGAFIKYAVGANAPELQDIPAVAVPFAVLHDKTLLGPEGSFELPWRAQTAASVDAETVEESTEEIETETPAERPDPYLSFHPVDESYFYDALFIGDSRTDGLRMFARIPGADYFCTTGMSSFNTFERTASDIHDVPEALLSRFEVGEGESISVEDEAEREQIIADHRGFGEMNLETLLSTKHYGKIYIMLGINEIGSAPERVCAQITEVVNRVRELQPDAYIFLMANLTVTRQMQSGRPHMTPERFELINGHMASMADQRRVFYINANSIFADEAGYLRPDITGDGCHLYAVHYSEWVDFIMQYGVG